MMPALQRSESCPSCGDAGTVLIGIGPIDRLSGQPDEVVEAPCPACEAGDREAMLRIGRSWRDANTLTGGGIASEPRSGISRANGSHVNTDASSPVKKVSSSQGPLDSTDPRYGEPGAGAEGPSASGQVLDPHIGDPQPMGPVTRAPAVPFSPGGGRRDLRRAA
jgi:hypothetical protein